MDWIEFIVTAGAVVFGVLALIALINRKIGGFGVWGVLSVGCAGLWYVLWKGNDSIATVDGPMLNGLLVGTILGLLIVAGVFAKPDPSCAEK